MDKALNDKKTVFKIAVPTGAAFAVVHSIAAFNNWYRSVPWIDIPLHFWGGVLSALIFYFFAGKLQNSINIRQSALVSAILVVGWVSFVGVLWEFGEFGFDRFIAFLNANLDETQLSLRDTLGDLFFDILGGATVAIVMQFRYHKEKSK